MSSQAWAELREFERRLRGAEDLARGLTLRAAALDQDLRDVWQSGGAGGFRTVNLSLGMRGGYIPVGGSGPAVPAGIVIQINDNDTGQFLCNCGPPAHGDSAITGTFRTQKSTINLLAQIVTNPGPTRLAVLGSNPATLHVTTTRGTSTASFPLWTGNGNDFVEATGYAYVGLTELPVTKSTLKLDDTSQGIAGASLPFLSSGSGHYSSSWGATIGGVSYTYFCYSLSAFAILSRTVGGVTTNYQPSDITSLTSPTDNGSVKFRVSIAVAGGTVTIYET